MESPELGAYQAALLEALDTGLPPREIKELLLRDERARPFADYVATFDERSIEVLAKLLAIWGVRTPRGPAEATRLGGRARDAPANAQTG